MKIPNCKILLTVSEKSEFNLLNVVFIYLDLYFKAKINFC